MVVAVASFFLGRATAPNATSFRPPSVATLEPPGEIHEPFGLLACDPNTTIGIEGCAEEKVLALDARLVASERQLFSLLHSRMDRREFLVGAHEWLSYRRSTCLVAASAYQGGTLAPVAYADCLVLLDQHRVSDLATTLSTYANH